MLAGCIVQLLNENLRVNGLENIPYWWLGLRTLLPPVLDPSLLTVYLKYKSNITKVGFNGLESMDVPANTPCLVFTVVTHGSILA